MFRSYMWAIFRLRFNLQNSYTRQRILCIIHTVKHNYILPISTVRIQLHVSALYVDRLQVEILTYRLVIQDVRVHLGGRGGGDEISLFQ